MGTSISQPSSRTTNWKPVHSGYTNKSIPESRIINEIWRASENESTPISAFLKTKTIYDFFSAVKESGSFQEAIGKVNEFAFNNKENSIVTEFAKRVIPVAFASGSPADNWTSRFFCEVTNYVISRDTSGFVGAKYRNKSVAELIEFKKSIATRVVKLVDGEKKQINNKRDWNSFVDQTIKKLKDFSE